MADRAYCSHGGGGLSYEIIKNIARISFLSYTIYAAQTSSVFSLGILRGKYTFSAYADFADIKMQKSSLIAE